MSCLAGWGVPRTDGTGACLASLAQQRGAETPSEATPVLSAGPWLWDCRQQGHFHRHSGD